MQAGAGPLGAGVCSWPAWLPTHVNHPTAVEETSIDCETSAGKASLECVELHARPRRLHPLPPQEHPGGVGLALQPGSWEREGHSVDACCSGGNGAQGRRQRRGPDIPPLPAAGAMKARICRPASGTRRRCAELGHTLGSRACLALSRVLKTPSMGSASSWYCPVPPSARIISCTMRPSYRAAYDAYRRPSSCSGEGRSRRRPCFAASSRTGAVKGGSHAELGPGMLGRSGFRAVESQPAERLVPERCTAGAASS